MNYIPIYLLYEIAGLHPGSLFSIPLTPSYLFLSFPLSLIGEGDKGGEVDKNTLGGVAYLLWLCYALKNGNNAKQQHYR